VTDNRLRSRCRPACHGQPSDKTVASCTAVFLISVIDFVVNVVRRLLVVEVEIFQVDDSFLLSVLEAYVTVFLDSRVDSTQTNIL